jgi:hypothetical protein
LRCQTIGLFQKGEEWKGQLLGQMRHAVSARVGRP